MKLLETSRKTVAKAVKAVVEKVVSAEVAPRRRDPFFSDDERRAAINAASSRSPKTWIPRRRGWLR